MVGESVENFGEPDEVSKTVQEIACADKDRDKDKVFPDIKVCDLSSNLSFLKTKGTKIT